MGLPLAVLALALTAWRRARQGTPRTRWLCLLALRSAALFVLVFLAARPVWVSREPPASRDRPVALLLDRSESMSLEDSDSSRYQQAFSFLRDRLLPAFKSANLPVQAMLFDEHATPANGDQLAEAAPRGKRTNLGGAIAGALADTVRPPLAVLALTDGAANESSDNSRALTALVDANVPFIGVGYGSDQGARTLTLRGVDAPITVAPKAAFSIAAQLEAMNTDDLPPFDLLLFRDGQLSRKKSLVPGKGSRAWLENFVLSEDKPGEHDYTVQLLPPDVAGLKSVKVLASAKVRIAEEKELRVLYIQGALTWDYKFIGLALRGDPSIKLTGLTRTSKQSVFRQNVENASELLSGFPTTVQELSPFRVVVLANLRTSDLTPAQQEVLARFCGELGGGVLMIGGPATFDGSWAGTRLEQLLPVVISPNAGITGLDKPFHIALTDEALQHPVFQIADKRQAREAWAQLPAFTQYGRVDSAKPGAQVWATHPSDDGPHGRRILMASQRYGAGVASVCCIQNFWRWRLSRDCDPGNFDRFWRQLFRFLSDVGRPDVSIHFADQELHPQMDVQVVLERQPDPKTASAPTRKFIVHVEDSAKHVLHDETTELEPLKPVQFEFRAEKADVYNITVCDLAKVPVASRTLEVRDFNLEFQNTARNMETLRQWASVSGGLALKSEECEDAGGLVQKIKAKIEEVRRGQEVRRPLGADGWLLALVAGGLTVEWILRKRWGLT